MGWTWWDAVAPAVVILLLLFTPGYVVAWCAGASPRLRLTAAPPVSLSLIAGAAVLAPPLGLGWSVAVVIGVSVLVSSLFALVRVVIGRRRPERWTATWWLAGAGVILGGGVHAVRLVRALVHPNAVSQTFDSPFHLNLVRSMIERSNGSFLHVTLTNPEADRGFYPAAWHELVSLAVQVTGAPISVSTNAATIAVTAVLWPVGITMLQGTVTRSWWAAAVGGAVSCLLPQMPNHLTWFGVLYPNLLAYSLIPFLLALLCLALMSQGDGSARPWMLFVLGLPGLAIAHPSGFFSLFVLSFPLVLIGVAMGCAAKGRSLSSQFALGSAGALIVLALYMSLNWVSMAIPAVRRMREDPGTWSPIGSVTSAIARALSTNSGWSTRGFGIVPFLLGMLIFVGALWSFRSPRTMWLPLSHVLAIGLYTVAFAVTTPLRAYVVGVWYGDIERLVALLGVTGVPLLAMGCVALGQGLAHAGAGSRFLSRYFPAGPSTAMVGVLVLVVGQLGGTLRSSYSTIAVHFMFDTSQRGAVGLLSVDEYELLERLPEEVPVGAEVLGNPWNGSVFAPAVGARDFAFPHVADVADPDAMFVAEHLPAAGSDPRVCQIVRDRDMRYVLDFGDDYLWGGDPNGKSSNFPGLVPEELSNVTKTVDHQGAARLLEITACD